MSALTDARDPLRWVATRAQALVILAYAIGAAALAGQAAVHIQQYVAVVHDVRWIGPLFLANAAACAVTMLGLAYRPTQQLAALAGVVTSALALGGLVVSYGQTLFGWQETGFRSSVAIAVVTEVVATIVLTLALALVAGRPRETPGRSAPPK